MFTGIVEARGVVVSLENGVMLLDVGPIGEDPIQLGESIATNGCCLTVVAQEPHLRFDLSPETMNRTSFRNLKPGSRVNLERALKAGSRMGGHWVQGHVDATAEVVSIRPEGNSVVYRFRVPEEGAKYLIDKGSVTLDGISLTVVNPQGAEFDVWVIPTTLTETNLGERQPGDIVNLEYDVLARYTEKMLAYAR